jgi:hypothetical protein
MRRVSSGREIGSRFERNPYESKAPLDRGVTWRNSISDMDLRAWDATMAEGIGLFLIDPMPSFAFRLPGTDKPAHEGRPKPPWLFQKFPGGVTGGPIDMPCVRCQSANRMLSRMLRSVDRSS